MKPLSKDNMTYFALDLKEIKHYLLQFDNAGRYKNDKSVYVDFDLLAKHMVGLDKSARKFGYKVKKVIIKIEFKDELYAT